MHWFAGAKPEAWECEPRYAEIRLVTRWYKCQECGGVIPFGESNQHKCSHNSSQGIDTPLS
jgi:hypothetical protein